MAACSNVSEEIGRSDVYRDRWQRHAILPTLPTVGAVSDGRTDAVALGNRAAPDSASKLPGTLEWE